MEPLSTMISLFFGYYIGTDLYNYYKSQQNFRELESELININRKLDKIDNRLGTMNDKLS